MNFDDGRIHRCEYEETDSYKVTEMFMSDTKTVEASVFNLSLMGEMVNGLDDSFIEQHHEIHWHKIRGLRNRPLFY